MKNLLYPIICLFLLSMNISAQQMKAEAVKPFNDGLAKSKQGDYKGSSADFQNALNYDKDYRIYYQLGFAQMKLNDLTDAVTNFNNSIKANPKFDAAYNDLGNVYYGQGKYQDAINNFEKVLDISKDNGIKSAVKYNLALSYTQLSLDQEKNKNYKSAVSLLNKAVQYNNYDEAYFLLARNYVEDNQYDNAIQSSEKALKYRKNIKESGPDYYLGVAYSQKGEMTKAEEYLNKAKKDPVYKSSAEEILKAINK